MKITVKLTPEQVDTALCEYLSNQGIDLRPGDEVVISEYSNVPEHPIRDLYVIVERKEC